MESRSMIVKEKETNVGNIAKSAWQLKLISFRGEVVRWLWHLKVLGFVAFISYIALPIFLMDNSWIVPKLVFSTLVKWPPFVDPSYPTDFGLNSTRNFYFDVEKGIMIGAWHTLPASLSAERDVPWEEYEDLLRSDKPIFLYLHGNSGTRGAYHRIQMYKFLSRLDAHVLTVDYRGFADSTGVPTEEGVVKDAYFAFKWLKEKSGGAPVVVWGHSLGTGISTSLSRKLCDEGDPPLGLILESPFNNIVDAAIQHPFAFPFANIPGFKSFLRDSAMEHNIHFSSDKSITRVTSHIMILHAEDDRIVPYDLGEKLYQVAKSSRSSHTKDVKLVNFDSRYGYGHKNIYKAPELKEIVTEFLAKCSADL
ncbi:lysophosphatidylserine lipase ABHD12-like [Littorina saxatilis]|uniref:AB hydrolase-1 domain-containing protein n=1 Tax=Littorina saxatilis TaxID=31220 RepID=A0AAN9BE83_9CAEN